MESCSSQFTGGKGKRKEIPSDLPQVGRCSQLPGGPSPFLLVPAFHHCSDAHFVSLFFQLVVEPSTWRKASSTAPATQKFIPLMWNVSGILSVPLATSSSCLLCKSLLWCIVSVRMNLQEGSPVRLTGWAANSMCVPATVREFTGDFRKSVSRFPVLVIIWVINSIKTVF